MRVTEKGQVTIPKNIRRHLGIAPGVEVEFELRDGEAIIRPVRAGDRMREQEVEGFTMLMPEGSLPFRVVFLAEDVVAFIPAREIGSGLGPLTAGRDLPPGATRRELERASDHECILDILTIQFNHAIAAIGVHLHDSFIDEHHQCVADGTAAHAHLFSDFTDAEARAGRDFHAINFFAQVLIDLLSKIFSQRRKCGLGYHSKFSVFRMRHTEFRMLHIIW